MLPFEQTRQDFGPFLYVIVTLVNEYKTSGRYNVMFDGINLASGIYFYKITAGNFTDTKKFILMKKYLVFRNPISF